MPRRRFSSASFEPQPWDAHGVAALSLGLRFLALAVVTGSGLALPSAGPWRFQLACGVAAGAVVAVLQFGTVRRWGAAAGTWFVPAHVLLWTFLTYAAGGQGSPLFVGFLLEVPLSGTLLSRRGCLLATATGAAAYVAAAWIFDAPLRPERVAIVLGFLAVSASLTWFLIEVLERKQRQIERSRDALLARAGSLTEELQLLGDYMGGALMSLDAVGRITSLNPAGAVLIGIDRRAALGRPWQEVLKLDPRGVRSLCIALAEGDPQRGVDSLLERPDGTQVAVQAEVWVTPSASGRRTHVLLDGHPDRAVEDDPVRRLGEAAGCVAHQIKNSIHALQGLVEQMEGDGSARKVEGVCALQYVAALRTLAALADDVLGMAGAAGSTAQTVPLQDVVRSALALGHWPGVRVSVGLPESACVRTSQPRLVHALFNLIDNACRASGPGGHVEIRAEPLESEVRLEIVDSGPGMSPRAGAGEGAVASGGGSGFGLVAVRRFLDSCGGRLSFHSHQPTGTRCCIYLPAPPQQVLAGSIATASQGS